MSEGSWDRGFAVLARLQCINDICRSLWTLVSFRVSRAILDFVPELIRENSRCRSFQENNHDHLCGHVVYLVGASGVDAIDRVSIQDLVLAL